MEGEKESKILECAIQRVGEEVGRWLEKKKKPLREFLSTLNAPEGENDDVLLAENVDNPGIAIGLERK